MEAIKHPLTTRFRGLRMYRTELDELVALFARSCASVIISDQHNRYDSLDEMKRHVGRRVSSLDILGRKPDVHFLVNQKETIRFAPPYAPTEMIFNELRTEEISEQAEALFFRVKDFLQEYQSSEPLAYAPFGLLLVLGAVMLLMYDLRIREAAWASLMFGMVAVSFASILILVRKGGNYLVLDTKLESPSFLVRYRDEFARHAITAAISAVVAGIVGYLVGRFLK